MFIISGTDLALVVQQFTENYPFQIKDVFCRRTPHLRYEDPSINTWTYFFADEDIGRKEVPAVTFGNILINVTREQMIHRETQLIMSTISRWSDTSKKMELRAQQLHDQGHSYRGIAKETHLSLRVNLAQNKRKSPSSALIHDKNNTRYSSITT